MFSTHVGSVAGGVKEGSENQGATNPIPPHHIMWRDDISSSHFPRERLCMQRSLSAAHHCHLSRSALGPGSEVQMFLRKSTMLARQAATSSQRSPLTYSPIEQSFHNHNRAVVSLNPLAIFAGTGQGSHAKCHTHTWRQR